MLLVEAMWGAQKKLQQPVASQASEAATTHWDGTAAVVGVL